MRRAMVLPGLILMFTALAPQPAEAARIKLRLRPAQADPFEGRGAASPRARNEDPTAGRPRSPVAANAAAERARAALAAESAARGGAETPAEPAANRAEGGAICVAGC